MIQVELEIQLKGLQLCSLPKVQILKLNGPKSSVKRSLKIWDFLQTGIQLVIEFFDLFKGSLGKNLRRLVLGLRAKCIESAATSSMTVSFNYFSSLMFSILFLYFLSITISS